MRYPRVHSDRPRLGRTSRLLLTGMAVCGLLSVARTEDPSSMERGIEQEPRGVAVGDSQDPDGSTTNTLLREGTRIQELGHFIQLTNDSAIFVDRHGRRLTVLKNLNLQRIVHMPRTTRTPDEIEWNISGMITEFEGENYLLITRIIRKSETAKPGPPSSPPATPDNPPNDPNP